MRTSYKRALICCLAAGWFATSARAGMLTWDLLGNGHGYEMVVSETPLTWQQARDAAATRLVGGFRVPHLVTILSRAEERFLDEHFPVGEPAWIGWTDEAVEGEWRWIVNPDEVWKDHTGVWHSNNPPVIWQDPRNFPSPIQTAYTSWYPGQPAIVPADTSDHGLFNPGPGGRGPWEGGQGNWTTGSGTSTRYIVEWERAPEPSTLLLALVAASLLFVLSTIGGKCRKPKEMNHETPTADDRPAFDRRR